MNVVGKEKCPLSLMLASVMLFHFNFISSTEFSNIPRNFILRNFECDVFIQLLQSPGAIRCF